MLAEHAKRDIVDQLMDVVFAKAIEDLNKWIPDENKCAEAEQKLLLIKSALQERNGNYVRSHFDSLLAKFMEILQVTEILDDPYQGPRLGKPISENLRNYLVTIQRFKSKGRSNDSKFSSPTSANELNGDSLGELDVDGKRLLRACFCILHIGNQASHDAVDLTFFKTIEICAAIGALTETLPLIYDTFKMLKEEKDAILRQDRSAEAAKHVRKSKEQLVDWLSRFSSAPSSPTTTTEEDSEYPPLPSAGHTVTPPSFALVVKSKSSKPIQTKPKYKLFYNVELDDFPSLESLPKLTKIQYGSMKNHMKAVPKANLCTGGCRSSDCNWSHSYMEVMKYNPFFKRFKCLNSTHYSTEVRETDGCPCIHVETGLKWGWMQAEKKKLCDLRSSCPKPQCIYSHSVIEVSWYNPFFRISKCNYRNCLQLDCSNDHNEQERRFQIDDFIGSKEEIKHFERTHQPLADLLDNLKTNAISTQHHSWEY